MPAAYSSSPRKLSTIGSPALYVVCVKTERILTLKYESSLSVCFNRDSLDRLTDPNIRRLKSFAGYLHQYERNVGHFQQGYYIYEIAPSVHPNTFCRTCPFRSRPAGQCDHQWFFITKWSHPTPACNTLRIISFATYPCCACASSHCPRSNHIRCDKGICN
jgi:hypothetical protein